MSWRGGACAIFTSVGCGRRAQWSQSGVCVRGELYPVVRIHFAKRQQPFGVAAAAPHDGGPAAMET